MPGPEDTPRPDALYALMLAVGRAAENELFTTLEARGFEGLRSGWGAFANICPQGSRLSEVAKRLGHSNQATGEVVTELERLGYVERNPDPRDGRAKLISLTERGRCAEQLAFQTLDQMEAEWAHTVGTIQAATLRATLAQIHEKRRAAAAETTGLG